MKEFSGSSANSKYVRAGDCLGYLFGGFFFFDLQQALTAIIACALPCPENG